MIIAWPLLKDFNSCFYFTVLITSCFPCLKTRNLLKIGVKWRWEMEHLIGQKGYRERGSREGTTDNLTQMTSLES